MGHGAVTFARWGVALVVLAVAAVVALGALDATGGERPGPIEVAGSAVPGGDGQLRPVEPARLEVAEPLATAKDADATISDSLGTPSATAPAGTGTGTGTLPDLGTVTDPATATDPIGGLLGPLPLLGTTTTTTAPGASPTTTTLLPGLPPLTLPPLPTVPLLPPLGG